MNTKNQNALIRPLEIKTSQDIEQYIPQTSKYKTLISQAHQQQAATQYLIHFFRPWQTKQNFDQFNDGKQSFSILKAQKQRIQKTLKIPPWGENFHRIPKATIEKIVTNMNLKQYPNQNKPGIMTHNANVRYLPTLSPFFNNFRQAGQGFPFDMLQNSQIAAGEPIHILQISKNSEWALVVGPAVYGWIEIQNIAFVSQAFIRKYKTGNYISIIKDNTPMKNTKALFRINAKLGAIFPIQKNKIIIPIADANQNAIIEKIHLHKNDFRHFPWKPTPNHFATLIQQLIGEPYGWGGLFGYRDCSATTRDILSVFGIWLPRDSGPQQVAGKTFSLQGLTNQQKKKIIREHAKPFLTFVGLPGHVILYIGEKNHSLYGFHNIWGLQTADANGKHQGRAVIGKAVITKLELGKSMKNITASLLDKASSLTIL